MKRVSMLVMSAICISLLSGCGETGKKLTCNYNIEEDGSNRMEYVLNFDKKGEKLTSYTQSAIRSFEEETSEEDFTSEYEEASKTCDNYKDMKGVKCDATKEKKSYRVELKVNLKEIEDAGKETLSTSLLENMTYEDLKARMESSMFECK